MHMWTSIILFLLVFVIALLPVCVLAVWVAWRRRSDTRRSPLTTKLRHLPGEQARLEAERLMEVANGRLLVATLIGPLALAMWAFQRLDMRVVRFGWSEVFLVLLVACVAFLVARSAVKPLRKRRNYLDGLAAERATAQELAPLVGKGCAVYHDVPGEKFNLDHVVVGPNTVFMVETKFRRKPAAKGKASALVTFDGKSLLFPGWRDTQMLDQVFGQTRWLAEYLYAKTGERVRVKPVLALPGWYVKCSARSPDVHVINPRMHNFMADVIGPLIPDPQRRRIMTAIEERYPSGDVS